jgi:hypothetical protein
MLDRGIFITKEPTIPLLPNTQCHEHYNLHSKRSPQGFSLNVLLPVLVSATQEPQLQSASNSFFCKGTSEKQMPI